MSAIPSFDDYVTSLGRLTAHVDPTSASGDAAEIKDAAASLTAMDEVSAEKLTAWAATNPAWIPALGLAVGLSREKLKNTLKHTFGTASWQVVGRTRPRDLIEMLD